MTKFRKLNFRKFLAVYIISALFLQVILPVVPLFNLSVAAQETPESYPVSYAAVPEVIEEETPPLNYPTLESEPESFVVGKKETFTKVIIAKEYVYSLNSGVKITFDKLPEGDHSFNIEEVEVEVDGVVSVGYDFTTDMANESFIYTLSLPNQYGNNANVKYSEDGANFETLKSYSTAEGIVEFEANHFTVFVVTSFEEVQITLPSSGYNGVWNAFGSGASVTQVPSGTDSIISSEGNYHAKVVTGAFTTWDGYKPVFPTGGYDTRVDVYVDMSLADGLSDKRIDFTSAISNQSGAHLRDFIFHLGTNPSTADQWFASASNNLIGWPANPSLSPVTLTETGWYTLEHQFRDVADVLVVTMNLYKKGESTPVGTWVRSTPSDVISTVVGGNRYGWFIDTAAYKFDWTAVDNAEIEYGALPINFNTVVVTADNLGGWNPTTTVGGQVEFINTLDAPLGDGVLNLTTQSDVQDRASVSRIENFPLDSIYSLSYQTKRTTGFIAEGNAALRILIDADGDTSTTTDVGYLVHEPYWQNGTSPDPAPVVMDSWQMWDVTVGHFWASIPGGNSITGLTNGAGGPPFYTIDGVLNLHPNAKVTGINVGIGSYNLNYDIEVDNVVIGYTGDSSIEITTYDFEPDTTAPAVPIGLRYYDPAASTELSCSVVTTAKTLWPRWDANIETDFSHYEYTSFDASNTLPGWSIGLNEVVFTTTEFVHGWVPPMDGVYGFAIRAVDTSGNKSDWALGGDKTLEDSCQYTVISLPTAPTLLWPLNNSVVKASSPIANDWDDVLEADHYIYQSYNVDGSNNCNLSSIRFTGNYIESETNSRVIADGLAFCWRVKSVNAVGESEWSELWKVTIDNTAPQVSFLGFRDQSSGSYDSSETIKACGAYNSTGFIAWEWELVNNEYYPVTYTYEITSGPTAVGWSTITSNTHHNGGIPQEGTYTVDVWATDIAGNMGDKGSCEVTYDATAPQVPTNGQPNGEFRNTNTGWYFTWSDVSDSGSPISYEYKASMSSSTDANGVLSAGVWDNTSSSHPEQNPLTLPQILTVGAAEGTWYWQVRAIDAAGNTSNWSEVWNVTIDMTKPLTSIHTPSDNSLWNSLNSEITISGVTTDNNGVSEVHLDYRLVGTDDWVSIIEITNLTNNSPFNWSHIWSPSDGSYDLRAWAEDVAGNIESTDYVFNILVDTVAPAVPSLLTPADGAIQVGLLVLFTWTDIDDAVSYKFQSCNVDPGDAGAECSNVKSTSTHNNANKTLILQPNGHYWWRVQAKDAAGNWSDWSESFELTIDNTKPTVNSLSNRTFYEGDVIPEIPVEASDDNLHALCITLMGPASPSFAGIYINCEEGSGPWSLNELLGIGSLSVFDTSVLYEGTYTVLYNAFDKAGNSSSIKTVKFNLLNVVPSVVFESNQTIDEGQEATFTASFTDPSSVDSGDEIHDDANWTAEIDYGDGSAVVSLGSFSEPGSLVIPNHEYTNASLETTIYTATLTVCESSEYPGEGQCTSSKVTVTVNNLVPTVTILASPSSSVALGTDIVLTADVTGGNAPFTYNWTCTTGETSLLDTITLSSIGTRDCTVTVEDDDGDIDSETGIYTIFTVFIEPRNNENETDNTPNETNTTTNQNNSGVGAPGPTFVEPVAQVQGESTGNEAEVLGVSSLSCEIRSTVSGYVYNDKNNNGSKDSDEEGISGVSVTIVTFVENEDGEFEVAEVAKVDTNSSGKWEVFLCPGEFTVTADQNDLPEGAAFPDNELTIQVEEDQDLEDENFAVAGISVDLTDADNGINWLIILLVVVAAGGLMGVIYFFTRKKPA